MQLLTCACFVTPMLSQVIPQLIPDQTTTEKTSVRPLITPHDPIGSTGDQGQSRQPSTVGPAVISMIVVAAAAGDFGPAVSTLLVIKYSERQRQQKVHVVNCRAFDTCISLR